MASAGTVASADVLAVATAYAGRDDWGVENVSLSTLEHLVAQLEAGVPAALIVDHAGHTGRACCGLSRYDEEGRYQPGLEAALR